MRLGLKRVVAYDTTASTQLPAKAAPDNEGESVSWR